MNLCIAPPQVHYNITGENDMSKFEDVYEEERYLWRCSEIHSKSVERLKEAYESDMKYQRKLLKKSIEASVSIINKLQATI